jgi:hypothetical protein
MEIGGRCPRQNQTLSNEEVIMKRADVVIAGLVMLAVFGLVFAGQMGVQLYLVRFDCDLHVGQFSCPTKNWEEYKECAADPQGCVKRTVGPQIIECRTEQLGRCLGFNAVKDNPNETTNKYFGYDNVTCNYTARLWQACKTDRSPNNGRIRACTPQGTIYPVPCPVKAYRNPSGAC